MITENLDELLSLIRGKAVYLHPIRSSDKYHPILTFPVACYGKVGNEEFIVPFRHPDGINVEVSKFVDVIKESENIFVNNKKEFLYSLPINNVKDLKFFNDKTLNEIPDTYSFWEHTTYSSFDKLNCIVPLVKLFESISLKAENINQSIEQFSDTEEFRFFNNIITPVFFLIEQQGLNIEYDRFVELYKPSNPEFNISGNRTYTYYNLYNITSRPTNSFNSINFAAIPKKEDYRKCFIPQNDYFVEFDFDGYHLRLLGEQIGYNFNAESAHTQLGRLFFNKETISEEEYTYTKSLNFKALYGNVSDDLSRIPFFSLLDVFTKKLWSTFLKEGYISTPISGKVFRKQDLEEMNEKKLLNYFIQSLETARNTLVLKEVLKYLRSKKTNLCLYTYDSVLLDFSKQDGKETLYDLKKILSQNDNYPVKFKYSNNLVL